MCALTIRNLIKVHSVVSEKEHARDWAGISKGQYGLTASLYTGTVKEEYASGESISSCKNNKHPESLAYWKSILKM